MGWDGRSVVGVMWWSGGQRPANSGDGGLAEFDAVPVQPGEAEFRFLTEHASDIIDRFRLSPDYGFEYMSPAVEALTGFAPEDYYADPGLMLRHLHPEDRDLAVARLGDATTAAHRVRMRWQHREGPWFWTEHHTTSVFEENGTVVAAIGVARDITEQVRAELELVESERLARSVLESIPGPTAVLDAQGRIVMVNEMWNELVHHVGGRAETRDPSSDYLEHCDVAAKLGTDGAAELAAGVRAVLAGSQQNFELDYPASADDARWFHVRVSPLVTGRGGVIVLHSEITERKHHESQLAHDALHDPLTGLPNRKMLADRLEEALNRARDRLSLVGVLLLDIDHFKTVNDALGHAAGDDLLRAIAKLLADQVRPGDIIARLGGDEFVMLCPDLHAPRQANLIVERVIVALRAALSRVTGTPKVTASIGVAVGDGSFTGDVLLKNADVAMYAAKERGRDRFEHFGSHTDIIADTAVSLGAP